MTVISLKQTEEYVRQGMGQFLEYIMSRGLFGTKSLSGPMLTYIQVDPNEYISIKLYLKLKSSH